MTSWTTNELDKIGAAEELEIASLRGDGSLRKPVTIWVVRLGEDLYVRSVNGRDGAWFHGTQGRHSGRIQAGGIDKDVTFVDADPSLNTRSTAPTASNTAVTPGRCSIASSLRVPVRRRSSWCPAQPACDTTI